ncbi:hypothetical protein ACJJTC_003336 [Scirpophaga incertulas]
MSDIDYFSAIDSDSDVSFHSVASLHNASIASLSAVISGNPSRKLRSLIDCSNFVLLPLDPTHHNVSSHDTWIDHIITSSPDHVIDHGQLSASGFSRHDLLFISYKVKPPKVPAKLIRMRNLARINVEQLKLDARSIDWSPLHTAATVDDMISTLNSEVLKLFNHHAPVVDVRVKRPPAPRITDDSCTDSPIDLTSDATTPDNRQRRRKKVKKKTSGSDNTGSGNTTEREVGKQVRRSPSPVDVMETDSAPPPPSDAAPGRQPSPPPQPFTPPSEKEELMREMMLRIGGLINARFEGLEGRLLPAPNLRPPLAADKKKAAAKAAKEAHSEAAPKPVPKSKGKKAGQKAAPMPTQAKEAPPPKGKNGVAKSPDAAEATASTSTSTPQTAEGWNVVVSRKAKAKMAKAAAQAAEAAADASKKAKANKRRPRKKRSVKAPRNPAVVLSISADAAASLTYAQVMAKAREGINWSDLGVEGLKLRGTATGARLMELPKATSPEKADQLAARLKEVLPPEVTVSRPVKCAEVRISGLDDSVTEADVRAAIARVGGCPEDAVRVGGLRFNPYTLGSICAKCPIPAAKAIGSNKLLIGCTSARVTLLDPRPMRCFRISTKS